VACPKCILRPIVRTKTGPTGTPLPPAVLLRRASKPPVRKFVVRWWLAHLFAVTCQRLVEVAFVQLLRVHVGVGPHIASFHWSIDAQTQMPRVILNGVAVPLAQHGSGVHGAAVLNIAFWWSYRWSCRCKLSCQMIGLPLLDCQFFRIPFLQTKWKVYRARQVVKAESLFSSSQLTIS